MTNKRKFSFISFLKNFIFIIPNLLNLFNRVISLSAHEAKIALKSLIIIFLLSFVGGALATTTWLGLLVMLYIYLTTLVHWTPLVSIAIVILVNVVMIMILGIMIMRLKKNLEFSETRKQLQVIKRIYRE